MKHILVILILLFSTLYGVESTLLTIRIGSFPNQESASKALVKLNKFVSLNPKLQSLQKKLGFILNTRASGKYYITYATPFHNDAVLQEVLDALRKGYPDIYATKLNTEEDLPKKILPKPTKKVVLLPKEVEKETKAEPVETQKTVKVEEKKPVVQEKPKQVVQKKKEVVVEKPKKAIKLQKPVAEEKPNYIKKLLNPIFLYGLIGLSLLLFFLVIYLFSKLKKRDEEYKYEKMATAEKIALLKNEVASKEQLFAYVSHELRSPMTSALGFIDLTLEERLSMEAREYLTKVKQGLQHLVALVNDILDVSKIQADKLELEKKEFNINDVVNYAFETVLMKAKENNDLLDVDIDEDVPALIVGDSLRLSQILINLLNNSVKFTKDGEVSLEIKKSAQYGDKVTLEFTVSDSGIGMSEEQIKRLFQSFYQGDKSVSREFGGTGLGLFIAKQLLELMNGKISVESQKGVGTVFKFDVVVGLKDVENKRKYRLPSKKLLNKKVLIIDSMHRNLLPLMRAFQYFHYDITHLSSMAELKNVKEVQYDIIVINRILCHSVALKELENIKEKSKTKIIVLENFNNATKRMENEERVVDGYLREPLTTYNILGFISELYVEKPKVVHKPNSSLKESLNKLGRKNILVAEDNKLNQKLLNGLLKDTQIELSFAKDGNEVLELLEKAVDFDMILMDLNMPQKDGYSTAKEIRRINKFKNLPIIAFSADVGSTIIEKCLESGMQGYISKPIEYENFYKTLLKYLQKDAKPLVTEKTFKKVEEEVTESDTVLSVTAGLQQSNNDEKFYKHILNDFMQMYANSAQRLDKLCQEGAFKEARHLAMDIKDVALNIGAYALVEATAAMEYEFEKGSRSNYKEYIQAYQEQIEELFKEIRDYINSKSS